MLLVIQLPDLRSRVGMRIYLVAIQFVFTVHGSGNFGVLVLTVMVGRRTDWRVS